jgi:hypothetical protein
MDAAGLTVLLAELDADCAVARDASQKAAARIEEDAPGHLEACAFELGRFYNLFEKMLEGICQSFENRFEKQGNYYEKLLHRLGLDLEGIRPAFIPRDRMQDIRELKGFWHVTRHAYDLVLKQDRLKELADIAERLSAELPGWCKQFVRAVRVEQNWDE